MTPEPQADTAEAASRPPPATAAAGSSRRTASPLVPVLIAALTVVGGALGALLVYEFNSIDARFNTLEARLDKLEEGQDEIARTLAALVAELNARAAVDAALAGRLVTPGSAEAADSGGAEP